MTDSLSSLERIADALTAGHHDRLVVALEAQAEALLRIASALEHQVYGVTGPELRDVKAALAEMEKEAELNGLPDLAYCKYCYEDVPVEYGSDGSIIVCVKCGSGLALADDDGPSGEVPAPHG